MTGRIGSTCVGACVCVDVWLCLLHSDCSSRTTYVHQDIAPPLTGCRVINSRFRSETHAALTTNWSCSFLALIIYRLAVLRFAVNPLLRILASAFVTEHIEWIQSYWGDYQYHLWSCSVFVFHPLNNHVILSPEGGEGHIKTDSASGLCVFW